MHAYAYHPPPSGDAAAAAPPSPHVRITWGASGRRGRAVTEQLLLDALATFGALESWAPAVARGAACATYARAEQAAAAVHGMHLLQLPALRGLHLHARPWGAVRTPDGAAAAASGPALLDGSLPGSVAHAAVPPIAGLTLLRDFVTAGCEAALIAWLNSSASSSSGSDGSSSSNSWVSSGHLARRVQHFGYSFDYINRSPMGAGRCMEGTDRCVVDDGVQTDGVLRPPSPSATAAAATGAPAPYPLPAQGPLAALCARVAALRAVGDAADRAWAAALGGTCIPIEGGTPPRAGECVNATGDSGSDAGFSAASLGSRGCQSMGECAGDGSSTAPDQVTANAYEPGQGIAHHVDTHAGFQDGIVSLSLGCDTVMDFQRVAPSAVSGSEAPVQAQQPMQAQAHRHSLLLPARSLLVLTGEARFGWSHAIASRKADVVDGALAPRSRTRVSVTLRRVRPPSGPPCRCAWPAACMPQQVGSSALVSPSLQRLAAAAAAAVVVGAGPHGSEPAVATGAPARAAASAASPPLPPTASDPPPPQLTPLAATATATAEGARARAVAAAPAVEALHVHALYDAIASHFSHTRHTPWPRVAAFVAGLPPGSRVLDVGCGNGKYLGLRRDVALVGCDRSPALAAIAGGRGHSALVADALALPVRSGCVDALLCVAVLHHLSSVPRRVRLLAEALRVAAPAGGTLFVQAWAAEQGGGSKRDFSGAPGGDALVPWALARRFVAGSDADVAAAGGVLDAARDAVVFQRYVHAYSRGELEALLAAAAGALGLALVDARCAREAADVPVAAAAAGGGGGGSGGQDGAPVVQLLSSWWDRDNWCFVAERGTL